MSGAGRPEHLPVMLYPVVDLLAPAMQGEGSVYVDGTLGLAGHAIAILEACPRARLVGIDRDPDALAVAGERLARFGDRVTLVQAVYDELPQVMDDLGLRTVQAVLLDLGLSSLQIDTTERGFAYAVDAPLDMRMGSGQLTAADIVNTYEVGDLIRILHRYGEERFADRIARRIVADRPFATSAPLVASISAAIPAAARATGGHPAKRTFQALRIEVNAELEALAGVLPEALDAIAVTGRIAVLAYHSLEDRLVKQAFATAASDHVPAGVPVVPDSYRAKFVLVTRGAARPDATEVATNPRAASARLRAVERIAA